MNLNYVKLYGFNYLTTPVVAESSVRNFLKVKYQANSHSEHDTETYYKLIHIEKMGDLLLSGKRFSLFFRNIRKKFRIFVTLNTLNMSIENRKKQLFLNRHGYNVKVNGSWGAVAGSTVSKSTEADLRQTKIE